MPENIDNEKILILLSLIKYLQVFVETWLLRYHVISVSVANTSTLLERHMLLCENVTEWYLSI